ncbi:MAG: phosphoribosylamine--glycine ligase, partial [Treponema sp.]|nr:phosphoribosylamine--glycine ligase [Treponema sp.]
LPLMDFDFAELCVSIVDGTLKDFSTKWKKGAVCAPVAVSQGYPGSYKKGIPVAINDTGFKRTGAVFFAAGAERGAGGFLGSGLRTSGGRVLSVSAFGSDAEEAYRKAYDALRFVDFEGITYRRDIGNE